MQVPTEFWRTRSTALDVAPTQEELMTMTYVGWSGDQRVHADVLDSLESGMALALYLPTGARGSELKKMHLQSSLQTRLGLVLQSGTGSQFAN